MKDIKLVAAIVLAVLVVVFVLQNTEPVGVQFLAWTWTASRAFALLVVFLVGVVVGWLSRAGTRRQR
ncbi:MAG: lipopolysaccharide assembly protein LapA domain-containing protein [Halofilum sp. (in: g-proteobacteria)]|nr:lipopolysaccharide assembly protein LapA domain-containing protein [Halofilum sp. (in: g-proteobacteria)]